MFFFFQPEMIRSAGYPAEAHVIMTEDGYLLTLHRIPGGNNSLPVLLQHGLLSNSAQWIILGKDKAFPYLLADQGYDVWLGNFRGNIYSKAHISLSPSDSTFWDFSFNEMGIYDLPAMIKFITNMKSQPLHTYIGHSMGTTTFYIMASERPEIAQMVQMMISLAPAVFVNHMQSPIQYLVPFRRELKVK
ncbi:lipase 3-like [Formica exsecta]|uniref:lipase 3-like n=1 Tax=Formica exsecta TaxID=72781 RepID=UPI00114498A7|nr:lipase 3-like [Formica exsecta]